METSNRAERPIHVGPGNYALFLLAIGSAFCANQEDRTVAYSKSFQHGDSRVELLGVCRVSESDVDCWNADRKPNLELERDVKAEFLVSPHRNVPLKYGQKTRIAFFKVTNPPYDSLKGRIDPIHGSQGMFDLSRGRGAAQPDENSTAIRGVFLHSPLADSTASVFANYRKTLPASPRMRTSVGASLEYRGKTFTIRKIAKGDSPLFSPDTLPKNRWVIAMTAEQDWSEFDHLQWVAVGKDELVIRAIDENGVPVFVDVNAIHGGGVSDPFSAKEGQPKLFTSQISGWGRNTPLEGNQYTVYSTIDPDHIHSLYVFGTVAQRIEIKDIPLDPR